jgi:hypothetical protein
MNISVVCPVCRETLKCEFDGTLCGVIAITDLAIMELTTTPEISRHMDTHRSLNENRSGFEMDPRYWQQLRAHLELQAEIAPSRLKSLDDAGLGHR